MPQLVLISDTHGLHDQVKVPEGDILIHAGDFMNGGRDLYEVTRFARWWNRHPHPHKILIGGNHDRYLEKDKTEVLSYFENTIYLEDSGCSLLGLNFWGSPYTPAFMQWSFMRHRGEDIKKHWDKIPNDTDILVTHGPPWGILDQVDPYNNSEYLGCQDLSRKYNEIFEPKLHLFGHIHGSYGQSKIGNTIFVNASQVDEQYRVVNKPVVIEL